MAKSTKKKQGKRPDRDREKKSDRRAELEDVYLPRPPSPAMGSGSVVLDRLYDVVMDRRTADPAVSHSARLLSRGLEKVAQKFGEEAIECLIEGAAGNHSALVAESADVLYHLIVLWVANRVRPEEVWRELKRREGISGIAEKASRTRDPPYANGLATTKIP
jgi:phosphoribosyl-ATP pyrophosphohydrolase